MDTKPHRTVGVRVVVPRAEHRPFEVQIIAFGSSHPYVTKLIEVEEYTLDITIPKNMRPCWCVSLDVWMARKGSLEAVNEAFCEITSGTLTTGQVHLKPGSRHGTAMLEYHDEGAHAQ